jgi:hypothetical protein
MLYNQVYLTTIKKSEDKMRVKIDTVDYDYPSCGGITGNYNPVTGIFIFTEESNRQGSWTNRKIRLQLTPMERDESNLEELAKNPYENLEESRIKILRKGYRVQ